MSQVSGQGDTSGRGRRRRAPGCVLWPVVAGWFLLELVGTIIWAPVRESETSGALLVLRVVVAIVAVGAGADAVRRRPPAVILVIAGLLVLLSLATWLATGSGDPAVSVIPTAGLVAAALVLVSGVGDRDRTRRQVLGSLTILVWLSLLVGIIGLVAPGSDDVGLHFHNRREVFGLPQLAGLLAHPNLFAPVAGLALALQVRGLRERVARGGLGPSRLILLIMIGPVVSALAVLWSQSRTGLAAAVIAVIAVALPVRALHHTAVRLALFVSVLLLPFVAFLLAGLGVSGFNGRTVAWQAALDQLRAAPWWGSGAQFLGEEYWAAQPDLGWAPVHAHQMFLQPLGVTGLAGGLAAITLWGVLAWRAVAARPHDGGWALAAVAALGVAGALGAPFGFWWVPASYLLVTITVVVTASADAPVGLRENPAAPTHLGSGLAQLDPMGSRSAVPDGRAEGRRPRLTGVVVTSALVAGLAISGSTIGQQQITEDSGGAVPGEPSATPEPAPSLVDSVRAEPMPPVRDQRARSADGGFEIIANRLGVHSFSTDPQMPTGSIRHNCWPAWAAAEPVQGRYDWTLFDQVMDRSETWGFRDIMYVFCHTPRWAGEPLDGEEDPSAGTFANSAQAPADLQDFEDYVRAVVERYAGRISTYQTWNEGSTTSFWNGTPRQLARMTDIVHRVVRELDPGATVLSASSQTGRPEFLHRWLPAYLKQLAALDWPVDVITLHGYVPSDTPVNQVTQTRERNLRTALRYLDEAGAPSTIEVWDTEVNFGQGKGGPPQGRVIGKKASAYPVRAHLDAWRIGVRRTYWYLWTDDYYAFPGIQMRTGDPSTRAMRVFGDWVIGATYLGHESTEDIHLMRFEKDGEPFVIAYPRRTSATITLDGRQDVCRVSDGVCRMRSGEWQLSVVPVRIS